MSSNEQTLGVELRFRLHPDPSIWQRVLITIVAWEPQLQPTTITKLADPEQLAIPWSEELAAELAQRCATQIPTAWMLAAATILIGAITVEVHQFEISFSIALLRPDKSLPDLILRLIEDLHQIHSPVLVMLFDLDNPYDAEVIMQGLQGLTQVSPLLYLDNAAVEEIGGRQYLQAAPCKVIMTSSGILLVTRTNPWIPPTEEELQRVKSVEQYLCISSDHPLILS